jgi:hypothetical protein
MSTSLRLWRYFSPRLLKIRDFSGGLNVREAPPELAPNESPDLWNVTLDERGGVAKRLGYVKVNLTPYGGGIVQNILYSGLLSDYLVQAGASIYLGTNTTARKTFTTSARCGMCEFTGKVWAIHPVDGLFSSPDGITWTAIGTGPKGDSITSWQNRLVTNDFVNTTQINASTIGDGTDWTTAAGHGWTNQIRENPRDGSRILCLASASGVDIQGRPGLIICKRDSTYRMFDSSTGAYSTLDPSIGAASSISVTNLFGLTIILSRFGIFQTDGINPLKKMSSRVDPLFNPDTIAEDQLDLCAAGSYGNRCYFSVPRRGQTANNLAFEFHPIEGWIVIGSNAASCYTTYASQTQRLYTGSPTVTGQVYKQLTGGADDGATIQSWFQTKWFEPTAGYFFRARKVHLLGRGVFNLFTRFNYTVGQGVLRAVNITGGGFVWGTGVWGTGVWGPVVYQNYSAALLSLGTGRAVSFRIEETSSASTTAPPLPGTTDALSTGAWGLGGIDLQYIQLGID